MDLTTKEKVKDALGITFNDDDSFIATLCTNVTDYIAGETQRNFDGTATLIEYYDGIGIGEMTLREFPIIEVTEIAYNAGTPFAPVWYPINPANYVIYYERGTVYGSFPKWHRNIRVTYKAGYTAVPAELELLATQLVSKEYEMRHAQGKTAEIVAGTRIDWKTELTPSQQAIINDFIDIKL